MAWVTLKNLVVDKDKNLKGLIPLSAEATFIVGCEGDFNGAFMMKQSGGKERYERVESWEAAHGKKMTLQQFCDNFPADANDIEWFFLPNGRLVHTSEGPVKVKDKYGTATFIQLDILDWLKQQDSQLIDDICACMSWQKGWEDRFRANLAISSI